MNWATGKFTNKTCKWGLNTYGENVNGIISYGCNISVQFVEKMGRTMLHGIFFLSADEILKLAAAFVKKQEYFK